MRRIKLLRAERGLTQQALAERAQVSRTHISLLERDGISHRTHAETLYRLGQALGVTVEELIDEETAVV